MRIGFVSVLLLLCAACSAATDPITPKTSAAEGAGPLSQGAIDSVGPRIHLCTSKTEGLDKTWVEGWTQSVRQIVYEVGFGFPVSARPLSITIDPTPQCSEHTGTECAAEGADVFCHAGQLARLFHAIALESASSELALLAAGTNGPDRPMGMEVALTIAQVKAFNREWPSLLVKEMGSPGSTRYDHFQRALELADQFKNPKAPISGRNGLLAKAGFAVAARDVVAFFLGHEVSYAQAKCTLPESAGTETDGTLARTVAFDTNEVCDGKPVSAKEAEAETCGLRAISLTDRMGAEALSRQTKKVSEGAASDAFVVAALAVGQRTAIDAISTHLEVGSGFPMPINKDDPNTSMKAPAGVPERLNRALRLYLFAATLHDQNPKQGQMVNVCDETAERFTIEMETVASLCASERSDHDTAKLLADSFPQHLALSVVEGWKKGALWYRKGNPDYSPARFQCTLGD